MYERTSGVAICSVKADVTPGPMLLELADFCQGP